MLAAALAVASLACSAEEFFPYEVFHVEDVGRWGSPRQVVIPEYPPELLERKHTGHVDFEGSVSPLHDLENVTFQADSPASEPFVAALKEVLPQWAFYPHVDNQCQPVATRVRTRVWFELDGERPKISVSRLTPRSTARPSTMKSTFRRDPKYPSRMLREGLQAYVYAAMHVDPQGKVTGVTSQVFPRTEHDLTPFLEETERTFKRWEFTPAAPGVTRSRTACMEVFFRLK